MLRKAGIAAVAALALAGSADAASRWIITSIHQIKPSVLKQIRAQGVVHAPNGARGPQGPPGPPGPPGNPASVGVHVYAGPSSALCQSGAGSCDVGGSDARCTSGPALGGGWDGETSPPVDATAGYNEPDVDGMGWHVIMANDSPYVSVTFHATVTCANSGASVARAGIPAAVTAQIRREEHALRNR